MAAWLRREKPDTAKRVLLVGWDAAEWKIIRPLVERGWMPNLAALIDRGASGNLNGGHPLLSPTRWASIVTGQHPTRHGVLASFEVGERGRRAEAIGRDSCKAPPLWSILNQHGIACHAINFPATHPAERLGGVSISNRFAAEGAPKYSVSPKKFHKALAALRLTTGQIDSAALLTFVPRAAEVDSKTDLRLAHVAAILAHTATVHAAATWAMERTPWQFAAVCYTGLHQFSHAFMRYHPPRLAGVDERSFEIYREVVTAAYRFHDMMLGRLVELAGPRAHVVVVSDHGFHCDHLRPTVTGATEQASLAWHRPTGVCAMAGPMWPVSALPRHASIFDITPTILELFGLGHEGSDSAHAVKRQVPKTDRRDDAVDYLQQLGYAEPADQYAEFYGQRHARRRNFHLAIAWLDARQPARAVPLLEALVRESPDEIQYRTALAHAYADARRIGDCRRLVDEFLREYPTSGAALAAAGLLELAARRSQIALEYFQKAEKLGLRSAGMHADVGRAYLRLRKFAEARRAFEQALALDDDLAAAHGGLGMALLGEGETAPAADACSRAVSLWPADATFHYGHGLALLRLGKLTEARAALEEAVKLDPEFSAALHKLAEVCDRLGHFTLAQEYDRQAHLAVARRRVSAAAAAAYTAPPSPR
jgi:predicted AlkP superfamily phosphohydrolase/phosphomutase/Flp pilus assembly protein TadD